MKIVEFYETNEGFCRVYFKKIDGGQLICVQQDGRNFTRYSTSLSEPAFEDEEISWEEFYVPKEITHGIGVDLREFLATEI